MVGQAIPPLGKPGCAAGRYVCFFLRNLLILTCSPKCYLFCCDPLAGFRSGGPGPGLDACSETVILLCSFGMSKCDG